MVTDLKNKDSEYEYDANKAIHAIEFIENYCKHSKGKWGGKPVILELFQKAFIAAIFGFVHKIDGTRKYREVFLVVARKNEKSTIASGIGLYLQVGDGEGGSEVYAVSTKKDQAKIVCLEVKRIIYNNNPIDKWCLSNTSIEIDKNLNIQPCKTNNQRIRIDGTAALLNAYVILQDKMNDYFNII